MSKLREGQILRGAKVTQWLRERGVEDNDTFTAEELDDTVSDALEHFLMNFVAKEDLREIIETVHGQTNDEYNHNAVEAIDKIKDII